MDSVDVPAPLRANRDDETPSLMSLAERILTRALYADENEAQYIDWDLVEMAYTAVLSLAIEAERSRR